MAWSFTEHHDETYHVTKEGYDGIARLYERVHLTYRKTQGTFRYEEDLKRASRTNSEQQQRDEILRRMG